jgi:hypothetical protein
VHVAARQPGVGTDEVSARRLGLEREDPVRAPLGFPDVLLFPTARDPDVDVLEVGLAEPLVDEGVLADQPERGLQVADGPLQAARQEAPDLAYHGAGATRPAAPPVQQCPGIR